MSGEGTGPPLTSQGPGLECRCFSRVVVVLRLGSSPHRVHVLWGRAEVVEGMVVLVVAVDQSALVSTWVMVSSTAS